MASSDASIAPTKGEEQTSLGKGLLGEDSSDREVSEASAPPLPPPDDSLSSDGGLSADRVAESPDSKTVPSEKTRKRMHKHKRVRKFWESSPTSEHNIFTHLPKCKDCDVRNSVKTQRAPHRSKLGSRPDGLPDPEAFADSLTADHKI